MNDALIFLLETFLGLFALALLVRFYLLAVRAPARNPLSNFVAALTNFAVLPARRVIPGLRGYDLSTLLLAWLVEVVLVAAVLVLKGYEFSPAVGSAAIALLCLGALNVARVLIYILMFATVVQAVLSWVSPYSPAMSVLGAMTRPFLQIFQRRLPTVGGVDLSPLFVLVICQILLIWPVPGLEALFSRML